MMFFLWSLLEINGAFQILLLCNTAYYKCDTWMLCFPPYKIYDKTLPTLYVVFKTYPRASTDAINAINLMFSVL